MLGIFRQTAALTGSSWARSRRSRPGRGPSSRRRPRRANTALPLLIENLQSAGALRPGLSRQQPADTVWAVNATEVYQLLTWSRG